MIKRIIAAMFGCILLACSATSALAYTERYCQQCNDTTRFYDGCSKIFSHNEGYFQHTPNTLVCNYYNIFYLNKKSCNICRNTFVENYVYHLEAEVHDICGGSTRCPF